MGPTMEPIVAQVCVQLSQENGMVAMVTRLSPSWYHSDWCKFAIHLRSLNVHHFATVETMGLKIMALRSIA
jgi:hypothetical protein